MNDFLSSYGYAKKGKTIKGTEWGYNQLKALWDGSIDTDQRVKVLEEGKLHIFKTRNNTGRFIELLGTLKKKKIVDAFTLFSSGTLGLIDGTSACILKLRFAAKSIIYEHEHSHQKFLQSRNLIRNLRPKYSDAPNEIPSIS
ncbi:hypothetical protein Nepgr_006052 [Nepenthes gracilis]|uniref:Uncharacterized protein n=1 Tax=Nepenthes gracilis TaxID=150966 RepID=A0AAD3XH19_NEPGR|nr:hypothetical protein Nepgr_006052 [Nepenthes gracilis]